MTDDVVRSWQTAHGDTVEVFVGDDGDYHWRVEAVGNHENVGGGEGHPELSVAVSAAERHHPPVTSNG